MCIYSLKKTFFWCSVLVLFLSHLVKHREIKGFMYYEWVCVVCVMCWLKMRAVRVKSRLQSVIYLLFPSFGYFSQFPLWPSFLKWYLYTNTDFQGCRISQVDLHTASWNSHQLERSPSIAPGTFSIHRTPRKRDKSN